jgi:hypothetical protein
MEEVGETRQRDEMTGRILLLVKGSRQAKIAAIAQNQRQKIGGSVLFCAENRWSVFRDRAAPHRLITPKASRPYACITVAGAGQRQSDRENSYLHYFRVCATSSAAIHYAAADRE